MAVLRGQAEMAKVSTGDSHTVGRLPAAATATVEQYAYTLIQKHYRRLVSREALVLKDKDPEDLHQMRVAIRRLQTAIQIFKAAIVLPKAAQIQSLQSITKRLGKLRDLDVQLDTLKADYAQRLDPSEHLLLQQAIAVLVKQRKQVFSKVKTVLKGEVYQELKAAYEGWLEQPHYTPLAQQSLTLVLPELLSPLLSELLLHPGWLIPAHDATAIASPTLHDLRKICKHVRYQAEFFTDFYEPAFKQWIQEIKGLQDSLGQVHDIQVLQQILIQSVPEWAESIHLRQMLTEQHEQALELWRSVRVKYLSPDYRLFLHQLLLSPLLARAGLSGSGNGAKGNLDMAPSEQQLSVAIPATVAQPDEQSAVGEERLPDSETAIVVTEALGEHPPATTPVTQAKRQAATATKSPVARSRRSPRRQGKPLAGQ